MITTTLISSCRWKTLVQKTLKHDTNGELLQNHTENQIMPSKGTVNWLFTDI